MRQKKPERITTRVQLELPITSMERLNSLVSMTGATSYAEVIRSALKVYKTLADEQKAGNIFRIVRRNGSVAEVHFIGVD